MTKNEVFNNDQFFYIFEGNNGATYIFNVGDYKNITHSLEYYKARSKKQTALKLILKLYLSFLSLFSKLPFFSLLKNSNEIESFLQGIVAKSVDFGLNQNCSILVSPTRDKIIVNHHEEYFHKFAFGNSYKKVKSEAKIYERLDKPLHHFQVSTFHDYIIHDNDFCHFKLSSQLEHKKSDIDLTLALVEMFNVSRIEKYFFSSYLEGLKNRCLKNAVIHESIERVLNKLEVTYKNVEFSVGLVHRDFKPWNINDENGLLIYDFEEAVTDGPPLEDLLNYHIDPIVRYFPVLDISRYIFKKERVNEYKRYLQMLEISLDFQVLLYCYLIERIIFWMKANEQETSEKYRALFEYLVMEY